MNIDVLSAFYSCTGSPEALARAFEEGTDSAGATARLRRARELVKTDVMHVNRQPVAR
jgi:hypothetical protein